MLRKVVASAAGNKRSGYLLDDCGRKRQKEKESSSIVTTSKYNIKIPDMKFHLEDFAGEEICSMKN